MLGHKIGGCLCFFWANFLSDDCDLMSCVTIVGSLSPGGLASLHHSGDAARVGAEAGQYQQGGEGGGGLGAREGLY